MGVFVSGNKKYFSYIYIGKWFNQWEKLLCFSSDEKPINFYEVEGEDEINIHKYSK